MNQGVQMQDYFYDRFHTLYSCFTGTREMCPMTLVLKEGKTLGTQAQCQHSWVIQFHIEYWHILHYFFSQVIPVICHESKAICKKDTWKDYFLLLSNHCELEIPKEDLMWNLELTIHAKSQRIIFWLFTTDFILFFEDIQPAKVAFSTGKVDLSSSEHFAEAIMLSYRTQVSRILAIFFVRG